MKRVLSFLAASLVISLATSAYAQSTVTDVNSQIAGTTVTTAQLPKQVMLSKAAEIKKNAIDTRREARREAARRKAMERREAKQQKMAEQRHMNAKEQVLDFRNQHPLMAHEVLMHKPWLVNHGISPVKAIRNPEAIKDRIIADRRGK